jgi:hypothetical protein
MKYFLILPGFFLFVSTTFSQEVTQGLRGIVRNSITKQPLQGANIVVSNQENSEGAVTDDHGLFLVENLIPGRYKIQVSFTGFSAFQDELLIIAGRSSIVNIELTEAPTVLSEITFEDLSARDFSPSLTSISVEKTMRIPANFFDPVRMATSYPGVVASNDQANGIIVKGNSPNGLLWRLNGLNIVNPNHLANAGTEFDKPVANGGGVNILSAQMLDQTDFYTGAFPVQYGNALAGVFDMKLRNGNPSKDEYTVQASLLGLDFSTEGPFTKNKNGSYLVNYRYSTVGLLSKLGVQFGDEDISFQDLSFNLALPGEKGRSLKVFGLGGISKNLFEAKKPADVEEDKDNCDIEYDSKTFAVGFNYEVPVNQKGTLFFGATYSSSDQGRKLALKNDIDALLELTKDDYRNEINIVSTHIRYARWATGKLTLSSGVLADLQRQNLNNVREHTESFPTPGVVDRIIEGSLDSWLLQPYINSDFNFSAISLNLGMHYIYYSFNQKSALEPRLNLNVNLNPRSIVHLTYRLASQVQSPVLYFINSNDLGLTRSHHGEIGYSYKGQGAIFKSQLFYQHLYDVPVGANSTFSAINLVELSNIFFSTGYATSLVNKGSGDNYGINITAEKPFFNNHYFIIGASYYESKYKTADGVERNSRFNGNYTFTGTYGKEWRKQQKKRTIGLNSRVLYLGGLRESKLDYNNDFFFAGEPTYDVENPYSEKLKDYFRIDLRISFRKDKPGYTRTFAIDIQNLTSNENEAYHYFDYTQQKVLTKYQLGIIPVLVYRIDF